MSTNHTPGPWSYDAGDHGRYGFMIASKGHVMRASVTGLADMPEKRANARLIAAAPELLEALKALLANVQSSVCYGSGPAQDAALAAIAKATGEGA